MYCGWSLRLSLHLTQSESGHRWRGSLSWHVSPGGMAYYTYSEGMNPGGFNRAIAYPGQPPMLFGIAQYTREHGTQHGGLTQQYGRPASFNADSLINHEIGFKSEFLNHRVIFNVSAYYMDWQNVQQLLFDPAHFTTTAFNVNGSSYLVKGFEVQFVARISDGLVVQGSSSVNTATQTDTPCLRSVGVDPNTRRTQENPTPRGTCITQINDVPYTNPFGQRGTRPPFAPPWMFNLLARYDWTAQAYRPFAWVAASHVAAMSNQPASFPDGNDPSETPPVGFPSTTLLRYQIPGHTTYDAGFGVGKDTWTAQLQCHNVTNAYGPTNVSDSQFIKRMFRCVPGSLTSLSATGSELIGTAGKNRRSPRNAQGWTPPCPAAQQQHDCSCESGTPLRRTARSVRRGRCTQPRRRAFTAAANGLGIRWWAATVRGR